MVYTVKLDDQLLYDPRLADAWIQSPKLSQAVNAFDAFDFTIYPQSGAPKDKGNPLYDQIKKRQSIYKLYKDNVLISRGRVMADTKNRIGAKLVECNGQGDFLNDSRVPIYDLGLPVVDLLRFYIDEHNKQMHGDKQKMFTLRNVTVQDPNNYLPRANSSRPKTWEEIQEKLIKPLGGFLVFDYDDDAGICYLDYLKDSPFSSNQKVQRGKNLLDLTDKIDTSELYTAVIGYGAQIGQSIGGKEAPRLNVMDINNGLDYVCNQAAVDKYGWNYDVQVWDDVTTPQVLLQRMNDQLEKDIQLERNLQLTAVDLSVIDKTVEDFSPLDYIWGETVINAPEQFMIDKVDTDLQNPATNKLTIGKSVKTLTDITNSQSVVKGADGDTGAPGFTPSLMNDNVTFPANAMGGVLSYEGGNTNISVVAGDGTYFTPRVFDYSKLTPVGNEYIIDILKYRPNDTLGAQWYLDYMNDKVKGYVTMTREERSEYDWWGPDIQGRDFLEEWIRTSTRTQYIRCAEARADYSVNTGDSWLDNRVEYYRSLSYEERVAYDLEEATGAMNASLPGMEAYKNWIKVGSTSLAYANSLLVDLPLAVGEFAVYDSAEGITLGTSQALPANHIIAYGNPSNMDIKSTTAKAIFEIVTKTSNGVSVTDKVQNFTKLPMGITGDAGVDDWTVYRYSRYANGGASDGSQMTSLPDADTIYIGYYRSANIFASSNPTDYTWSVYEKATIAKTATEPPDKWVGRLWQYTGTSALTVGSVAIQPQTVYIWNGGRWDLYITRSTNLQVDNGFISNAMIGRAQITNDLIVGINGTKIDRNSITTNQIAAGAITAEQITSGILELSAYLTAKQTLRADGGITFSGKTNYAGNNGNAFTIYPYEGILATGIFIGTMNQQSGIVFGEDGRLWLVRNNDPVEITGTFTGAI